MAIDVAGEATQTKLYEESREEQLSRFFQMEVQIQNLKDEREKFTSKANALKNEIKAKDKEKVELLNDINKGQLTVSITPDDEDADSEDAESDLPSDDELDAMDTDSDTAETEAGQEETAEKTQANDTAKAPSEWLLLDDFYEDEEKAEIASIKCKKQPVVGDIQALPASVRGQKGKVAYIIRSFDIDPENGVWKVRVDKLTPKQKTAALKAKKEGVPF
jgi:hypothetical protein